MRGEHPNRTIKHLKWDSMSSEMWLGSVPTHTDVLHAAVGLHDHFLSDLSLNPKLCPVEGGGGGATLKL